MGKKKGCGRNSDGDTAAGNGHAGPFFIAVASRDCTSIWLDGYNSRRRGHVPVCPSPALALQMYERTCGDATEAVVLKLLRVPDAVSISCCGEGFKLMTNHVPPALLEQHLGATTGGKTGEEKGKPVSSRTTTAQVASPPQKSRTDASDSNNEIDALKAELTRVKEEHVNDAQAAEVEINAWKEKAEKAVAAQREATSRVNALTSELAALKKELDANTNSKLSAELRDVKANWQPPVLPPRYWKHNAHEGFCECVDVTSCPGIKQWFERWMVWSSHFKCKVNVSSPNVVKVTRVESWAQWMKYTSHIRAMSEFHKQHGIRLKPVDPYVWYPPTSGDPPGLLASLNKSINEHLLFHGTRYEVIKDILVQGFDANRCKSGKYGQGFYFAQEFCKAAQYSMGAGKKGKGSGEKTMSILICRVALGDTRDFQSDGKKNSAFVRPRRTDKSFYDALIANPSSDQVHREFVAYEAAQVYVEYIVDYSLEP